MSHRAAIAVLRVMMFVTLLLLMSCSQERPLQSPPMKYLLYVAMSPRPPSYKSYVLVVDCATDSVVDSLAKDDYWGRSMGPMIVSPDCKYLLVNPGWGSRVWDLVSRTEVAALSVEHPWAVFVPHAGVMVGGGYDSALTYTLPDFNIVGKPPQWVGFGYCINGTSLVAGLRQRTAFPTDYDYLVYDMDKQRVTDSIRLQVTSLGANVRVGSWRIDAVRNRLFVLGADAEGTCLIGCDLTTRSRLFRATVEYDGGHCWINPAGDRIWVTYPQGDGRLGGFWPYLIYIFDARTGTLLESVDPYSAVNSFGNLFSGEVQFLPDGTKAYVTCGSGIDGPIPVLVIRTLDNKVERVLFDDYTRIPRRLALGIDPNP